eukprot:g27060.t1
MARPAGWAQGTGDQVKMKTALRTCRSPSRLPSPASSFVEGVGSGASIARPRLRPSAASGAASSEAASAGQLVERNAEFRPLLVLRASSFRADLDRDQGLPWFHWSEERGRTFEVGVVLLDPAELSPVDWPRFVQVFFGACLAAHVQAQPCAWRPHLALQLRAAALGIEQTAQVQLENPQSSRQASCFCHQPLGQVFELGQRGQG